MITPAYEILQTLKPSSFLVREFLVTAFTAPYHYHPEYELTLIINGEGKRFVGSHMESYDAGDIVMVGSNLPHCWKSEKVIRNRKTSHSIVIQFSADFLGQDFFKNIEMNKIQRLLLRSAQGIAFLSFTQQQAQKKMVVLVEEINNFNRLILLLELLQYLANSSQYRLLDLHGDRANLPDGNQERINNVFAYVVENFRKEISLPEAASIANMTPNAFCKYFKKTTSKTFFDLITEYRLNYALERLVQTNNTVSEICFESGFGNVSHFNKTFKRKIKFTPLEYRNKFNEGG